MMISGRVHRFGDNVDTDVMIPARHCITDDVRYLAEHCMEDISDGFYERCNEGDVIIAGKNFGCGSSREAAVMAVSGCGIKCIIAESFARLFYRNAVNNGLLVIENKEIQSHAGELEIITVDTEKRIITANDGTKIIYDVSSSSVVDEIVSSGGLMQYYLRTC